MTRSKRLIAFTFIALLAFSSLAYAIEAKTSVQTPVARMQDWQSSSIDAKRAFLNGFTSMLDIERVWQVPPIALDKSLVSAWATGLSGVTYEEMQAALDAYAKENPDKLSTSVIEVLWVKFVQPKLTPAMREQVKKASKNRNITR